MNNKRLMILGTNEYQNPVIDRAKELGYETHVYGLQRGEIGEKTADFFHPVDVCDFERMWDGDNFYKQIPDASGYERWWC